MFPNILFRTNKYCQPVNFIRNPKSRKRGRVFYLTHHRGLETTSASESIWFPHWNLCFAQSNIVSVAPRRRKTNSWAAVVYSLSKHVYNSFERIWHKYMEDTGNYNNRFLFQLNAFLATWSGSTGYTRSNARWPWKIM